MVCGTNGGEADEEARAEEREDAGCEGSETALFGHVGDDGEEKVAQDVDEALREVQEESLFGGEAHVLDQD